jgi:hypothetical protein
MNPYRVPGVDELLAEAPEQPPRMAATTRISGSGRGDCFTALPPELCAEIAMYLPTSDLLSARLASRAFWPVFHSQQFWASRFRDSSERSWLFEAHRERQPRDWRWLYRRTLQARNLPLGLYNRQRIWGLIQGLLDALSLAWNELPAALPGAWSPDPNLPSPDQGTEGTGCLGTQQRGLPRVANPWHTERPTWKHWYTLRTQRVAVPCDLSRLSVSTVTVGERLYIAGLSLTAASGDTLRLGYSSPSPEKSVELSQLWGFHLAIGCRGVQALKCITSPTGSQSPWIGCPDHHPRTNRLVAENRVVELEAAFDVGSPCMQQLSGFVTNIFVRTGLQADCPDHLASVLPPTRAAEARNIVERLGNVVSRHTR